MTREEAIRKLAAEEYRVAPGQSYELVRLELRDARGVARCFFAVYGAEYPIDTGYLPERLVEENARGNIYSVVARTPAGDVVGYGALYRSSSPNPKLYELGQYMVLPDYRHGVMIAKMSSLLVDRIAPAEGIEIIFGESVCHHLATQKMGRMICLRDAAIEIALMPAAAYPREDFPDDRVSTLLQFRPLKDRPQPVYFPGVYREWLDYILAGIEINRSVNAAAAEPALAETRFTENYFAFAGVLRSTILSLGRDFDAHVSRSEQRFLPQGARVLQFILNLGEPSVACAVEALRSHGYFFGGFLPGWLGTDGLLMQKVLDMPDFRSIKLHSERARKILGFIEADLGGVDQICASS